MAPKPAVTSTTIQRDQLEGVRSQLQGAGFLTPPRPRRGETAPEWVSDQELEAAGILGTNFDYLSDTREHLELMGIEDTYISELYAAVGALRDAFT